jgi:hypothetical protein
MKKERKNTKKIRKEQKRKTQKPTKAIEKNPSRYRNRWTEADMMPTGDDGPNRGRQDVDRG